MHSETDTDDILDLPPLPSPHRETTIARLTAMLVAADEGDLIEFTASGKTSQGQHYTTASGCEDIFQSAGHMIFVALRRMGFVTMDELEDYVRKDEE